MAPYEPAINTTMSSTEKVKHWLDRACAAARHNEGLGVIGFVTVVTGDDVSFEPFSSAQLKPEDFVELIAAAARGMISDSKKPS